MMLAYVLGPADAELLPASSPALASVNRGGGWVKCCVGSISIGKTRLPSARSGSKLIFAADASHLHEAVEDQLATRGAEDGFRLPCVWRDNRHGRLIKLRRRHLAGDETVPDQLIQLRLIRRRALRVHRVG